MSEDLKVNQQKKIINNLVEKLAQESTELYYTDSMTICNLVVEKIQAPKNNLTKTEYDLVKNLTRNDIQILLSYNSNCC
ncbi:MAG: hypothetical protein QF441_07970 [Bacteriovoracaceae bacterium]|jgi:hypothetical protein|nr:hypothetical protein [Halobacteriovoraceae bacterium]MDP7320530.1 hypothetical protein [Bacteriovoracaceae bacterium]